METTFSPVMGMSGVLDVPVTVTEAGAVNVGTSVWTSGRMVPTGVGDASASIPQAELSRTRTRPHIRKGRELYFIKRCSKIKPFLSWH